MFSEAKRGDFSGDWLWPGLAPNPWISSSPRPTVQTPSFWPFSSFLLGSVLALTSLSMGLCWFSLPGLISAGYLDLGSELGLTENMSSADGETGSYIW